MNETTILKGIGGFCGAVLLWEAIRITGFADPKYLPSMAQILTTTANIMVHDTTLRSSILATLTTWLFGLLIATLLGTLIGIVLAMSLTFERITRPMIEFLRPIPSVALIPLSLLVLGIGMSMQLFIIVFGAIWPVIFSVKSGVEGVEPRYIETGRVFGLSKLAQIFRIVIPATLPSVATGIRTAAAIALVLTITVEMLVGKPGIGLFLETVRLNGLVTEMWSTILIAGIVGYVVNGCCMMIEHYFIPWSAENRDH